MYGEIVLDRGDWFLVKWYNNPTTVCKYYRDTEKATEALYKIIATNLNLLRRVK